VCRTTPLFNEYLRTKEIPLEAAEIPEDIHFSITGTTDITDIVPEAASVIALFAVGHISYLENDAQSGRDAFDQAMSNASTDIEIENQDIAYFLAARNLATTGNGSREEAIEIACLYSKALEINSNLAAAYNNIALTLIHRFPEIRVPFTELPISQAIALGLPQDMIDCLVSAGIDDIAPGALFERAYNVGNEWLVPRFNQIAYTPPTSQDPQEKKANLEEIIRLDPNFAGPHIVLGNDAFGNQQYNEALMHYLKAHEIRPSQYELFINIAQSYLASDQVADAEKYFQKAFLEETIQSEALLGLARTAFIQRDFSTARGYIDQIPDDNLLFPLGQVLLAQIKFEEQNYSEAREILLQNQIQPTSNGSTGSAFTDYLISMLYFIEGDSEGGNEYLAIAEAAPKTENAESANRSTTGIQTLSNTWLSVGTTCHGGFISPAPVPENRIEFWGTVDHQHCPADDVSTWIKFLFDEFQQSLGERIYFLDQLYGRLVQCPFVFTFDRETNAWIFETTILYKLVGKENEQYQTRMLTRFDGRVRVREIEPEVSHIDTVSVIVEDSEGNYHELKPEHELLRSDDGTYLVLHQGEEVILQFPDYSNISGHTRAWIVAKGYYVPYSLVHVPENHPAYHGSP
jgi:tetratricopeptide (TPR) repeat protein